MSAASESSNQFNHIMVDIETLDTVPSAIILSIGACTIPVRANQFYVECEPEQPGRTFSQSTVNWWEQQDPKIKPKGTRLLIDNLFEFSRWINSMQGEPIIWAKGIDFDCAILANAYNQYKLPIPWKYNSVRDFRTLKKVCPVEVNLINTYSHNALADAKHQAEWLEHILGKYPNLQLS